MALHGEPGAELSFTGAVPDLPIAVRGLTMAMPDAPVAVRECTTAARRRSATLRGVPTTMSSATMAVPRTAASM
jgi:hypothetical protein